MAKTERSQILGVGMEISLRLFSEPRFGKLREIQLASPPKERKGLRALRSRDDRTRRRHSSAQESAPS